MTDRALDLIALAIATPSTKPVEGFPELVTVSAEHRNRFVKKLLDCYAASGASQVESIDKAMTAFEAIADKDKVGYYCMTSLWTHADEMRMHDVCNGIDLWMAHCENDEIVSDYRMMRGRSS